MSRDKAIELINDEMQRCPDDMMLETLGHRYIDASGQAAETADAIIAAYESGKNLKGAIKKSKDHFRSRNKNGVAYIPDAEVHEFIDKYFGVDLDTATPPPKRRVDLGDFLA